MYIKKLAFYSYRNLKDFEISPIQETNILYGDNAQGKTNLLESIWLGTGEKSFRPAKESELIRMGDKFFRIEMDIYSRERDQKVIIKYDGEAKKRTFELNGIEVNPSRISEVFSAVIFSPEHLDIVKKGPELRRKFIDTALCQLKPGCRTLIANYKRAVFQRNNLLKDAAITENLNEMLDVFEQSVALYGAELNFQRNEYCKQLQKNAEVFFNGISDNKEKFSLNYTGSIYQTKQQAFEAFVNELKAERKNDILNRTTSVGPHRYDLEIFVNDLPVKTYGSQGQQRSSTLALKLGEAKILEDISGERPIALLDDVMSELDQTRRDYLINRLDGWQVFITTCNPEPILAGERKSRLFYVKEGEISNVPSDR